MRSSIKLERAKRWKAWVEQSWNTKQTNIYKWIRGKKGQGFLIVIPGVSAQVRDRRRVAEEAWGGPWVVDVGDLPNSDKEKMDLIIEDEVRRVTNIFADGKAKGVDGWSPA
eukprot:6492229-Heterocapsa_arctica.AAC.1